MQFKLNFIDTEVQRSAESWAVNKEKFAFAGKSYT